MRYMPILNRFNFGEISPLLAGRVDFPKYHAGASRMENFIPLVQGPVTRRGGTKFIAECKYHDLPTVLLRFEFSENVAYVIEAGHHYFRFYFRDQQLMKDGQIYEIASPYASDDLFYPNGYLALKCVQSADVLYIVAPKHVPRKLARFDHDDWRLTDLGGWGPEKPNPTAITLFRERLCLAAGHRIWMSAAGAFEDFDDPGDDPRADDPIDITIYSDQVNSIEWLCPSGNLLVGTTGGEFLIGETTSVDPLGPANIKVVPETNYGSTPIQALRVGAAVLFMQRSGRRLREFVYDFSGDTYTAQDVSVAAEHITKGGLAALAWQSEPLETVWGLRSDGRLIGFTYNREQQLTAWHQHCLGGEEAKAKSMVVIPCEEGDDLWLLTSRKINGEIRQHIEVMKGNFGLTDKIEKAIFLDSAITYDGPPTDIITGLNHLEGQEVALVADGGIQPPAKVSGGQINLRWPASKVVAGLPYTAVLKTMNLDLQMSDGTAQVRAKRFIGVTLRLYKSMGGAAGPDEDNLAGLEYRKGGDQMDKPTSLFTGDLPQVKWPGGYETDAALTIVHDQPLPFTLIALIPEIIIEGRS